MTPLVLLILFGTAVTVAVGDAFLKHAALGGTMSAVLRSYWFYLAVLLYLAQIFLVVYLFLDRWKLGLLGNTFTVMYAILVVLLGYFFFQEKVTFAQTTGIALGVVSVYLMTFEV